MSEDLDVYLTVFIDTDHYIQIIESLNGITGVTGYSHSKGTNIVNVVAKWKESELENKRKEVEVIPNVKYVNINRRGKNVSKTLIENVNISDDVIAAPKRKYPITKKEVFILLIPIALVVASIPIMNWLFVKESPFWGILGIESTIALGVLLFLMQNEKDRRTNEIIQKQNDRYTQSKLFLCNEIIQNLHEFKNTYTTILSYIQDFDTKKNDSQYSKELGGFILLSNNKIEKNLIPVITEYTTLAIDKLEDVELGIQIRHYLDRLYGPMYVMEEDRKKGDLYCGLEGTPPVKDIIEEKIQEIEKLIVRMERERPTRLDTAVNKKT
jgi:hypothetical protein